MIRSLLMLGGLILTAPGVVVVNLSVVVYYIFVGVTLIYGSLKGKKCESIAGVRIIYIDYVLLILPFLIYFLHPSTDKKIFQMFWRLF